MAEQPPRGLTISLPVAERRLGAAAPLAPTCNCPDLRARSGATAESPRVRRYGQRVAITTGGVLGEQGPPGRALKAVMRRISQFAPPRSDDEYALDLGFFTWSEGVGARPPGSPGSPGVQPWMVGRKQRRFIVRLAVPAGLSDEAEVLGWLVPSLAEVARLCREYLPTKSKQYPAESLAEEVEALAEHLSGSAGSVD